jgi:dTDP-4-amino-4,6-dideoxygalactose transaminase
MSAQGRVVFGQPWLDDTEEELVRQTLRSGWIGQGPLVELFEERLGHYLGAKHVVAVSSCTAGLHLALTAAGVGPGAEVITTPFTFIATLNAITHVGARAVLVDIDRETLNLAPERVADAITPHTAAVLPVHFGGRPLDVVAYERIADEHGVWIIEDAAHAIGAVTAGARVGGRRHPRVMSVFSFYPNKNLASAEGGAVVLADDEIAERLRRLRLHGLDVDAWKRYRTGQYRPSLALEAGFKYNWTDLQAAIALGQLEKLEGFLATREYLAEIYDRLLAELRAVRVVDRAPASLDYRHALHLYQIAIELPPPARDQIVTRLLAQGIGAAVHYIGANHHPAYRTDERFPASDWASEALVTLPLHPRLDDADLARVTETLAQALQEVSA